MKKSFPVLLVTGNQGKLAEFNKLLKGQSIELSSIDLEVEELQSADAVAVGAKKIRQAVAQIEQAGSYGAVVCDDTALCLAAMGGLPGPMIKWFLKALGPTGIHSSITGKDPSAKALCIFSAYFPQSGIYLSFEGVVNGKIVPPLGLEGFGWDSIFMPDGQSTTYAGMDSSEKNQISHRALAVKKFVQYCASQNFI